jgi:hypothetical protein
MYRNGRNFDSKELSRRLGDRGDLVACLTSEIGTRIEQGRDVSQDDVDELEDAIDEISHALAAIEVFDVAADGGAHPLGE